MAATSNAHTSTAKSGAIKGASHTGFQLATAIKPSHKGNSAHQAHLDAMARLRSGAH